MSTTPWSELMPGLGGQPSAVPATPSAGGGIDPASLIQNIDPSLVKAAATPIPGATATTVPSWFTRPLPQMSQTQVTPNPNAGAGAANAVGIGNAVKGAVGALGAVVQHEAQHKQDQVRDAAQKVILSQQSIDEAKQQLEMAQTPEEAAKWQKQISDQENVRNGIFADPKMRKSLQKGFDISYTDPESNKTSDHAAVQEAMKNAKTFAEKKAAMQAAQKAQNEKAGKGLGEAFAKQQPQGLAPNTVAQSQYAAAAAQQKIQQEAYKDYTTFQASIYRSDKTVEAAKVREIGAGILQAARYGQAQDMLNQRMAQQEKLLGERFNQETKLVYTRAAAARQNAMDIFRDKESDPLAMYNKSRLAASTYAKNAIADGNSLVALQNAKAALYKDSKGNPIDPSKIDQNAKTILDSQIATVQKQIEIDKGSAKNFLDQASKLQGTFGLSEGSTDGGASSTDDSTDSIGSEPDYTDPLTFLNDSDN